MNPVNTQLKPGTDLLNTYLFIIAILIYNTQASY